MILYLRYCRTGVLFHITVHVKDQYVTTYDDVILVKPNRISRVDAVVGRYPWDLGELPVPNDRGTGTSTGEGLATVVKASRGSIILCPSHEIDPS